MVLRSAGRSQARWIFSGGSYQASSEASAHFGLGSDRGPFELEVTWPDGSVKLVGDVEPGRRLVVRREADR